MPILSASRTQELSQAKDPKEAILKAVGDLSKERVLSSLVLIGTYIRPERTAGGIIRPMDNIKEDEYQGKTGLVLKLGDALLDMDGNPTNSTVHVGEWVVYSIKDGHAVTVNGVACRLVPEERIRMVVSAPDVVF